MRRCLHEGLWINKYLCTIAWHRIVFIHVHTNSHFSSTVEWRLYFCWSRAALSPCQNCLCHSVFHLISISLLRSFSALWFPCVFNRRLGWKPPYSSFLFVSPVCLQTSIFQHLNLSLSFFMCPSTVMG